MGKIRFALALHNHQPVGNFANVFEAAYQDSYKPFLDLIDDYPAISFSLHTSGSLLEWLVEHHPEYVDRLRAMVQRGQVEIVGGGFYEPILTMIPSGDRLGQIRGYSEYLRDLFGTTIRGMWVPERVWEQSLVRDIVHAGIEYTILDDFHFRKAGLLPDELLGYYLTEDEGRLLRIFPGSETMRYLIPFQDVERVIDHLRAMRERHPDALIVFADDGEKFGTWPETKRHVYDNGWLRRFLDALRQNLEWIDMVTLAQAVDQLEPKGRVYLPDCSYREMTEWALPAARGSEYSKLWHEVEHWKEGQLIREFLKGGFWRNFKVRYPETNEMYARMLQLSHRLERLTAGHPEALGDTRLNAARLELYRAQCNCAYWHGAFGGVYLPHLRNAIYEHLLRGESHVLAYERPSEPRFVAVESRDLNFDGKNEIRIENDKLAAFLDPSAGGMMYELDVRALALNLGASLSRRPEAYHEKIRQAQGQNSNGVASIHDRVVFKQEGLDQKLIFDRYPRKSLLDHFLAEEVTLADFRWNMGIDRGDFVSGRYKATIAETGDQALVSMTRRGLAAGRLVTLHKAVSLLSGQSFLKIRYRLENFVGDGPLRLAVEFNFGALPPGAEDRHFRTQDQQGIGDFGTELDLSNIPGIGLVDEWQGIDVGLNFSKPAGLWAFPIESVNGSEAGFELTHQSVCVVPHWKIPAGTSAWEVEILLGLDTTNSRKKSPNRVGAALQPALSAGP